MIYVRFNKDDYECYGYVFIPSMSTVAQIYHANGHRDTITVQPCAGDYEMLVVGDQKTMYKNHIEPYWKFNRVDGSTTVADIRNLVKQYYYENLE